MGAYRVFRLRDHLRQSFRGMPHMSGLSQVKPRDYQEAFLVEADSPYAAWASARGTAHELLIGDVIELEGGELRILKFVGFEQASWVLPEEKQPVLPGSESPVPATSTSA